MEIFSQRELEFSVSKVYEAISNPDHLMKWWGPAGFTNTFHEFDLRPGGKWRFTMHGPENGNYQNEVEFKVVERERRVEWDRISNPHFYMILDLQELNGQRTLLSFRMRFRDEKLYNTISKFAPEKNEENFDRLENELRVMDGLL